MEKILSLNHSTNLLVSKYSIWLTQDLSEKVFFWITHKIRHTYAVLHCAQQIIKEDPILDILDRKIKKKIEIAALLHDIARFTQHNKIDVLKESVYEHWNEWMKILQENGFDDPAVLLAVKYHNKFNIEELYNEELYINADQFIRDEIIMITNVVRDADKLQNMEYCVFDKWNTFWTFFDWKDLLTVKEKLITDFNNWVLISKVDVETPLENLLNVWSWKFDINYEWTKKLLSKSGFEEFAKNIFKENNIDF